MAVRRKEFAANTVLTAAEVNDVQDNGVIQVNSEHELDGLPESVNLALVLQDHTVHIQKNGVWSVFSGSGANPLGAIQAYALSGTPDSGWQVCNGGAARGPLAALMTNVPDLSTRTIVGAGTGHEFGKADGAATNAVTAINDHIHTVNDHAHGDPAGHHAHYYHRGHYHHHYIRYRGDAAGRKTGSNMPFVRFDSTNTSHYGSIDGGIGANTNGANGGGGNTGGSAPNTGGAHGAKGQTLDNYPPNIAYNWIIYNGEDK